MPSSTICTSEDDPQEDMLLPPEPAEDEPRSALQQAPTNCQSRGRASNLSPSHSSHHLHRRRNRLSVSHHRLRQDDYSTNSS